MSAPRNSSLPPSDALDAVFSRLRRHPGTAEVPAPFNPPRDRPAASTDTGSPVEEAWQREERDSLEDFTRQQFALLRQQQALINQQRDDLIARQNALNETCLLRQQELNRQLKVLAVQTEQLEAREKEVADQQTQMTLERQRLAQGREDLNAYRRELAKQEEALRLAQEQAERLLAEAAPLRGLSEALERREQALARGEAELAARREELDELEDALARETAQNERALLEQRRELQDAERRLHLRRLELEQLQGGLEGRP